MKARDLMDILSQIDPEKPIGVLRKIDVPFTVMHMNKIRHILSVQVEWDEFNQEEAK